MQQENSLKKSVLETISYSAVFSYPLTFFQLANYLIHGQKITRLELERVLEQLVQEKKIQFKNEKYYLAGKRPINWEKRQNNTKTLLESVSRDLEVLAKIPWILFIGVTGSVAAHNPVRNDDIDIFIITKRNRIWIVRGFVFLILKVLGKLRTEKNPGGKICPNIFVDEDSLSWEHKSRNLYVAHEIILLMPVFDRCEIYFKFLEENSWVQKYFPNFVFSKAEVTSEVEQETGVMLFLENLARRAQLKYMAEKQTKEVTEKKRIHFNKNDHTGVLMGKFQKLVRDLGN